MSSPRIVLLDSDTVSAITRNHPQAVTKAAAYLRAHAKYSIAIITRYEVLRGLIAKGATKQQAIFEHFCMTNEVIGIDDAVIVRAAEIYATLHRQGQLIGDADILIAATALTYGYGVATNNERHFWRVAGLHVENWLK
jgi:tRNA(fMet)-specific endonuclease VapC